MQDTKKFSILKALQYAFNNYYKNWLFFFTVFLIIFLAEYIFNYGWLKNYLAETSTMANKDLGIATLIYTVMIIVLGQYAKLQPFFKNFGLNFTLSLLFIFFILFIGAFLNREIFIKYNNKLKLRELFKLNNFRYFFIVGLHNTLLALSLVAATVIAMPFSRFLKYSNIFFNYKLLIMAAVLFLVMLPLSAFNIYSFADYFCLDENLDVKQSFKESRNLIINSQVFKLIITFFLLDFVIPITLRGIIYGLHTMTLIGIIYYLPTVYDRLETNILLLNFILSFFYTVPYLFAIPITFMIKTSIYKQLTDPYNQNSRITN